MAKNRIISTKRDTWLKKIDSQTTFCKILLSTKNGVHCGCRPCNTWKTPEVSVWECFGRCCFNPRLG